MSRQSVTEVHHGERSLFPVSTVSCSEQGHGFHSTDICVASYDYGSTIAENRVLTSKSMELRRQGLFIQSSPDFYKTDWVGNSSSSAVSISNPSAFAVFLSNPDTKAGFYITRQTDSTST